MSKIPHPMLLVFRDSKSLRWVTFVLIFLISMPLWIEFLVNEKEAYGAIPRRMGNFAWISRLSFDDDQPIDIVFCGGSGVWAGINPIYLEKLWKERSGETIRVANLGHNWHGDVLDYTILNELMKERKAKFIFIDSPVGRLQSLHPATKYIWNVWDDMALNRRLPVKHFLRLYAEKILVSPRLLLTLIVPPKKYLDENQFIANKGHYRSTQGFYDPKTRKRGEYQADLSYQGPVLDVRKFIYAGGDNDTIRFSTKYNYIDGHLATRNAMAKLAKSKSDQSYFLMMPREAYNHKTVTLRKNETTALETITVSLDNIFPDREREDYRNYFYNRTHLNDIGSKYYASILVELISQLEQPK